MDNPKSAPGTMNGDAHPDYSAIVPSEVRRTILEAAIDVIAINALENVTMDRIADKAGVSRLKLYREFGNRSTLVEAVIAFRLMHFDQAFFAGVDHSAGFEALVGKYLAESTRASRENPVSRRWASGSMRFLHEGSLIHRTAVATWTPVIKRTWPSGAPEDYFSATSFALWLIALQYSLGRMVVETGLSQSSSDQLVKQFVLPAFRLKYNVGRRC